MPTTDQNIRDIRSGRRVICHKLGPYEGKRGRVLDVFAGQAKVRFKNDGDATSSVLYPLEYFEAVGTASSDSRVSYGNSDDSEVV